MFIPSFLNYRAAKINISIESSKENPKINIRRYHYFKDRASREQKESLLSCFAEAMPIFEL
jgi:hypothetical protein